MNSTRLILGGFIFAAACFTGCSADTAEDDDNTAGTAGATAGTAGSGGAAGAGGAAAGAGGAAAGAGGAAAGAGGAAAGAGGAAAGAGGAAAGAGGAAAGAGGGGAGGGGGNEPSAECTAYCEALGTKCTNSGYAMGECLTMCEPLEPAAVQCRTDHAGYSEDPGDDHCTDHAVGGDSGTCD